ncbi:unnamed protein product [Cunninghamella blakesleeana]
MDSIQTIVDGVNNMTILQTITDGVNSTNLYITMILKNIGVIIAGTLLFPILFLLTCYLLGFTARGIVAGSFAAFWMASIGNVSSGSVISRIQSLLTLRLAAFSHSYMIKLSIIGFLTIILMLNRYSFDVDAFLNDLYMLLHHRIVPSILIVLHYFNNVYIVMNLNQVMLVIMMLLIKKIFSISLFSMKGVIFCICIVIIFPSYFF